MSFSWADARSLLARCKGLFRRGMTSLRTRGWRQSWRRVRAEFAGVPAARRPALYRPGPTPFAPFALPTSAAPRASIVIPVYGQFAHTLACLRAIAAHPPTAAFEVIVVDDGSGDDTPANLPRVAGIAYVRRAANGGFIAACNDGAARARGEVLVFLNNDTVPQAGWLDAMLATFDARPDAGLVGAQLVYPDGRLQEAGGVVFRDGHAWNYGRNESPDDPRYSYLRDADYVSGAAIAIPRALFLALGGFDARYAPAYYEDTDLAFAVRAAGRRVLYQPAARVVHDEGATSGVDLDSGPKAAQVRNRLVFASHRADALAAHGGAAIPTPASLHRHQRSVLVIDSLTPAADRDSASLRLVNLMQMLLEAGAHVVFWPADRAHAGPCTDALRRMGVETWAAPFAPRAAVWLAEHGARFDVVMVCRHYVAAEFLPLLRRHAPRARVVFDTIDLHHLREARAAEVADDDALRRSAARTRASELAVIAAADLTLVVSAAEQALLQAALPAARVQVLSNLHRVHGAGRPFEARRDIVFVGGFRHPPNVDAVAWFVEHVFPAIRMQLPDITLHCIGADVPQRIAAYARRPGVVVHGHVPDLAPYMDGCRVAVAPLRFGAGVKGKVNLSMAHGQPVVATTCAVEGMHLQAGHDVLVADDAGAFAEAVLRLHGDAALWNRLAVAGLANVAAHFSMDAARDTVRRVFLD
ncbi:MAG TPA: glycosyltransferase [Luteimonas sp.]|nr:glycosyltransferase [Luteimonas sp.]